MRLTPRSVGQEGSADPDRTFIEHGPRFAFQMERSHRNSMKKVIANKLLGLILKGNTYLPSEVVDPKNKKLRSVKNGVYMALRADGSFLYVGMVSSAKTANIFMRFHGNGNSAHDKKQWWSEVDRVKFRRFDGADERQLRLIERLAIFAAGQPDYNDVDSDENALRGIEKIV